MEIADPDKISKRIITAVNCLSDDPRRSAHDGRRRRTQAMIRENVEARHFFSFRVAISAGGTLSTFIW